MPAQKHLCKQSVACYQGLMRTPILPLIPWLMVPRGSRRKGVKSQVCCNYYSDAKYEITGRFTEKDNIGHFKLVTLDFKIKDLVPVGKTEDT